MGVENNIFGLNRVRICRTERHTPNKNSQEYPPGENYTCKSFLNKLTPRVSCPDKLHRCSILIFVTDVSRQFHPIVIHLRLAINVWRERSLTMTELPLSAINGKRLLWLLENGLITQHWALRSLARVLQDHEFFNTLMELIRRKGIFEHR